MSFPRRPLSIPGLGSLLLLAACGAEASSSVDRAAAMQVVTDLQSALRNGNESACYRLVTSESKAAIAELPWADLRTRQPLAVLRADRDGAGYRVTVRDPNQGNVEAEMIVAREYGRLVVDLVATAGLTAEFTDRPLEQPIFEPEELTPRDLDRIRQNQLATPPK